MYIHVFVSIYAYSYRFSIFEVFMSAEGLEDPLGEIHHLGLFDQTVQGLDEA
jgi:hypothetical protein